MNFLVVIRSVLARMLFTGHALAVLVQTQGTIQVTWSAYLYLSLSGLVLEGIFSCFKRDFDISWVCPAVFFYLVSVLPPFWIRSLYAEENFLAYQRAYFGNDNCTLPYDLRGSYFYLYGDWLLVENDGGQSTVDSLILTQQCMLGLLIVGRWLLPKGKMSRDRLSQLLLIQVGIAADIADFYDALNDERVRCDKKVALAMLGLWTYSLMQFTLVSTGGNIMDEDGLSVLTTSPDSRTVAERWVFLHPEVYTILVLIFMQDMPFLCLRTHLMVRNVDYSDANVFFVFKNSMVIILGIYRVVVLNRDIQEVRNRELIFGDSYAFSSIFGEQDRNSASLRAHTSSHMPTDAMLLEEDESSEEGGRTPKNRVVPAAPTALLLTPSSSSNVTPAADSHQQSDGASGHRKRSSHRVTWNNSFEVVCYNSDDMSERHKSPLGWKA